jgi:hypothetical protein
MSEDELTEEEKRIMEEDTLEFVGMQREDTQDEWIERMRKINEDLINHWRRDKVQGQSYTDWRENNIREYSLKKENIRKEEKNKEKWEMRKNTLLICFVVIGFPFFMAICYSGNNSDPSHIQYDGRPSRR